MNSPGSLIKVTGNPQRPLTGCLVGISISECDRLVDCGFDTFDVNRCVARLAETLLGVGARLVFGHDWRPGGVMEAVAAIAVRYFPVHPGAPASGPPIVNRVAPPDVPFLDKKNVDPGAEHMRKLLDGIIDAQTIRFTARAKDPLVARARALSKLRKELSDMCDARICLGGRLSGYSGWFPGVAEEAYLAIQDNQPLFISQIFGGASAEIAQAEFGQVSHKIFEVQQVAGKGPMPMPLKFTKNACAPNGLTKSERKRLCDSNSLEECVELILRGLIKWGQAHHIN